MQDTTVAKDLVTGKEAQDRGVIYLEYSSVEIQAKEHGRKWKVYGSPVGRLKRRQTIFDYLSQGSPWFGGQCWRRECLRALMDSY